MGALGWKLLLAALGFELSALWLVLSRDTSNATLFSFLVLHAVSSMALAVFGWRLLPAHYRSPRWAVLALGFCFAFFIPLLGALGMLIAMLLGIWLPRFRRARPYVLEPVPEFVLSGAEREPGLAQGGIRSMLLNSGVPAERRLRALLVLQGVPARVASPMLRQVLTDAVDDIRLVAYGMLDSREKAINAAIGEERERLEAAEGNDRLAHLRRLAELNWELVYQGLAQGDVREHALGQVGHYLDAALEVAPGEPGLLYLKGRLLLQRGELGTAYETLWKSVDRGFSATRVLPYLAEVAYRRRDFDEVRGLLARIPPGQATPALLPVIEFWR